MPQPIDIQSAIFAQLLAKLVSVPEFGAQVSEDDALRVIDADDDTLPESLIVLQSGATEEVDRKGGPGSVMERVTINITLMTTQRGYGPAMRAGRVAVKQALAGQKLGLTVQGITTAAFQPETPMPPRSGRRWAAQVMPVLITYVQPLN